MTDKTILQDLKKYFEQREKRNNVFFLSKFYPLSTSGLLILGTDLKVEQESCVELKDKIRTILLNTGVTELGNSAFEGYPNLEAVLYSDKLTKVGRHAFANCPKLHTFAPYSGERYESMQSNPSTMTDHGKCIIGKDLKVISQDAFSGTGLEEVVVLNSGVKIRANAFEGCQDLKKLTIKDVNNINLGVSAFAGCPELMVECDVDALTRIAKYVFADTKFANLVVNNQQALPLANDEKNVTKTKIKNFINEVHENPHTNSPTVSEILVK